MPPPPNHDPVQLPLARGEHFSAVCMIEDELYAAGSALRVGQDSAYKARLQSAFISLQFLLREEVGE